MHVHNWAHYKSFISLLSFLSTCFSFLVVFLSSCNFSCNLSIFSVVVLWRFWAVHWFHVLLLQLWRFWVVHWFQVLLFWLLFNKGSAFATLQPFFFAMLSPLKFVLLAILIQVFLQVWECLIICYEIESNETFLFPNRIPKDKVTFQTMLNFLMLHQYKLISTFDLLFEKDLGDWVKARSTTWYSQFLMSQYSDPRWIEHFRVSKEFVFQLTMKLKHFMEKKDMHYRCVVHARIFVTCSLYKLAHGA